MLSVVVVAHGKHELTRRCLAALHRSTFETPLEVILVDNGSPAPLTDVADEFAASGLVRYLRNDANLAFSRANNLAARAARGRWLLFLNNDVMVDPGALASMVSLLRSDPKVGAVGGRLLYPGRRTIQHAGIVQMLWGYASNYGVGAGADDSRFTRARSIFAVTGAMLCVSSDAFRAVGGFDEGYRWGYEDVDLCLALRAAGRDVHYLPAATAVHMESATLQAARSDADFDSNYARYRARWGERLSAAEELAIERATSRGVRRVVVFGTGRAALGTFEALTAAGVEIRAFTTSAPVREGAAFCQRPVCSLQAIGAAEYDRLVVGSQRFWELEATLDGLDPTGEAWFPEIPHPGSTPW